MSPVTVKDLVVVLKIIMKIQEEVEIQLQALLNSRIGGRWSVLCPAKETARTAKSILLLETSLFISLYRYVVGRVGQSV